MVVVVICMLNFLIAIVSDSYNYIMEREKFAYIERREQISYAGMYEITSDEQIEAVILATKLNIDSDDQWEGVTKNIKKQISKLEANNVHRFASLKREIVSQTKHVENVISQKFKLQEKEKHAELQMQRVSFNRGDTMDTTQLNDAVKEVQEDLQIMKDKQDEILNLLKGMKGEPVSPVDASSMQANNE